MAALSPWEGTTCRRSGVHSTEETIRIVFEGLKGEESISELCRREGISQNLTSWSPPSREYNERPTRDEVVGVEMLDRDDPFLASIPGPDRWGCRPAHPPILPAASEATAEPEWLDA